MEQLNRIKDRAMKRMKQKNYREALNDYNHVIEKIPVPQDDSAAVLKSVCYLNRSACKLLQGHINESVADADLVIDLYNKFRTEEQQKSMTPEQLQQDELTGLLSLAYVRRGEAKEALGEVMNALHEYSMSMMLIPAGQGQVAMQTLLAKLGIPEFDMSDKDLQPFSVVEMALINEADLITSLTKLLEYIVEAKVEPIVLRKYTELGIAGLLWGVMKLYLENEVIVCSCLAIIRSMIERGIGNTMTGALFIKPVMKQWHQSEKIMGESVKLLRLAPMDVFKALAKVDFIPLIVEALKMPLAADEIEGCFMIVHQVASNPSLVVAACAEGIIDIILEKKTIGALLLLSKLSLSSEISKQIEDESGIEWAIQMLKENPESIEIGHASTVILARSLLSPGNPDDKEGLKTRSAAIVDAIVPCLMKYTKDVGLVSSAFSALALATAYAPEKIREHKVIRIASVIMSMLMKEPAPVQNIVTFFFECTQAGLIEDLKEAKPVLPTICKAMNEYPMNQTLIERAVIVTGILEHPEQDKFLRAGLIKFPESKLLKQYVKSLTGSQ